MINITLPDGSVRQYPPGVTGMAIAESISSGLARVALGIFVNDQPYDLSRTIDEDAYIRIVRFDDEEGKAIFWHSSAHLMAEAIEALYPGTRFGIGPPVEGGFYYDMDLPRPLSPDDLEEIERRMRANRAKAEPFVRNVVSARKLRLPRPPPPDHRLLR